MTNSDDGFYQLGHFFLLFSASFFSVSRPETNSSENQSDINNACFVIKCQDGGENENRNRLLNFLKSG